MSRVSSHSQTQLDSGFPVSLNFLENPLVLTWHKMALESLWNCQYVLKEVLEIVWKMLKNVKHLD